MSSHIVYDAVPRSCDNSNGDHTLFAGQKLWFSHAIPQRAWLIENAKLNGAVVVNRDVEADVRLVDHARKNNAPGTHSYKYVEASIRNRALEDLTSHAIGAPSRVSRPVGSTLTAPKPGRTPFTPEDDQFLWNWVMPFVSKGGAWKGNEIYKQLEEVNPRHTFQSWRDRWIKHTQYQKRHVTEAVEPQDPQPATPVAEPPKTVSQRKRPRELEDDGEAQRARGDQKQLDRRSPARRSPAAASVRGALNRAVPTISRKEHEPSNNSGSDEVRVGSSRRDRPQERWKFTRAEYGAVYHIIIVLLASKDRDEKLDDFEKPWEEFAAEHDSHTAAEWKYYCRSKVVPDYCKQHNLPIPDVAAHIFGEDQDATSADGSLEKQQDDPKTLKTSSAQDGGPCAICGNLNPIKRRQDEAGRLLCAGCDTWVRVGDPRRTASLKIVGRDGEGNNEDTENNGQRQVEEEPSHALREHHQLAPQSIRIPQADFTDRGRQAATTSSNDIAGLSQSADQTNPQPSRSIRSPSYTPQSPVSLVPESNTSRKRIGRRSTQSQSTQPSNPSNGNSQNTQSSAGSQAQDPATQGLTTVMGVEQSTEGNPEATQPTIDIPDKVTASVPSFQATLKGKRKRLQDEPTVLPSQQVSSLSTDCAPAGQRSVHPSIDSDREESHNSVSATFTTFASPSGRFETQIQGPSWPSMPQDDDAKEDVGTRLPQSAETDQTSPPVHIELVSDGLEINADSQSTSGRDNEEMEEDVDAYFDDLVPSDKRQISEGFETAQETPEYYETAQEEQGQQIFNDRGNTQALPDRFEEDDDFDMTELPAPPRGWGAYGVRDSIVPPDEENMGEGEPMSTDDPITSDEDPAVEEEEHEKSPEIKLEDESCLKPRDRPLLPLEYSPSISSPEADEPEGPPRAQGGVRRAEDQPFQHKEAPDESEFRKEMRIDAQRREAERLEAQRVETALLKTQRHEAERRKAQAQAQEPSSTTAVEDPPLATRSSRSSLAATYEFNAEAWIDEQLALYPKVRVLEPILFRALSATGYRDADLTTQVVSIMVESRKKHIRERLRESGKKALSNAQIDALDHEAYLPRDMPGVWTKQDDIYLVDGDIEQQDQMWEKHGRTRCLERFDYFSQDS